MAGGKTSESNIQADSDVHISYEDQMKINKFARENAKMGVYRGELAVKQNELKNVEEAVDELELMDDDAQVPYYVDEVFLVQDVEKTKVSLEEAKKKILTEMKVLEGKLSDLKDTTSDLKVQLYAKFGNRINLEED